MPTTAAATALKNSLPKTDSYVVKKLRESGVGIIDDTGWDYILCKGMA